MSPRRYKRVPAGEVADLIAQIPHTDTPQPPREIIETPPKYTYDIAANTIGFLKHRCEKLYLKTRKYKDKFDISSIDDEELYDLLAESTQLSMAIRKSILGYKDYGYLFRRKRLNEYLPVRVEQPQGTILRISIPPLIGRPFHGSYNIYWGVKIALEEYFAHVPVPDLVGKKLLLIYKKYAPDLSVCFTCDNDNWEAKRVTNAISEALYYSDNAEHFSMMYTAVICPLSYVEATVILLEDFPKFADYIMDGHPAQPLE